MRRVPLAIFFGIALGVGLSAPEVAQADFLLGVNLVVNGDAEAGDTSGWSTTGIEVAPRALAGTAGLPAGVDIGNFSSWGGLGPASSQALTQSIDVAAGATLIDGGTISSHFRILLQSRSVPGFTEVARLADRAKPRAAADPTHAPHARSRHHSFVRGRDR